MAGEFEGKVVAEKYLAETLIGSAGSGDLYSGRHLYMEKPVTLEILPPEIAASETAVQRFFDRAKAASRVSGPEVLSVSDFGSAADGTVYLVYEGTAGASLAGLLEHDGQLPVADAVSIAGSAARGLAAAHAAGVVHSTLKPSNILIYQDDSGEKRAKIFDLGIGRGKLSGAGFAMSDVAYLAPELYSGAVEPDARSDVYALGAVLYEMLAGDQPFKGETPTDVMVKHTEELPPALSAFRTDLPAAIEPVILRALSKDPDQRFQTALEFADALDSAIHPQAAAASGNNLWKTAFIVLAGITLLSAVLIYATSVTQTDPPTVLKTDANGQPVQPINPATGAEEQSLISMPGPMSGSMDNTNMMGQPPGTLPGGDGYNPWAAGGPPPGAPPLPSGGQVYTIDPNTGSPFMQPDGVILVPVPVNTNTAKPTPTPAPANTNAAATPAQPKPEPAQPKPAPTKTPAQKPPANKPAAESGDTQ